MSLASDLDNSNRNINEEFPIVIDNRPQYQQPPDPEGGWARRDSVQVPFLETGTSCSDIFLAAMAVEMAAETAKRNAPAELQAGAVLTVSPAGTTGAAHSTQDSGRPRPPIPCAGFRTAAAAASVREPPREETAEHSTQDAGRPVPPLPTYIQMSLCGPMISR